MNLDSSRARNTRDIEFTSKLQELKETLNDLKSNLKSSRVAGGTNFIDSQGPS